MEVANREVMNSVYCNCVSFTQSSERQDVGKWPPGLRLDHHMFDIINCWYLLLKLTFADF